MGQIDVSSKNLETLNDLSILRAVNQLRHERIECYQDVLIVLFQARHLRESFT